MTEERFCRSTPRKIAALADVHMKVNSGGGEGSPQESQTQTINDFMSW
jgi:hypothetical protein